ncbi:EAL domain-containing protein [Jatrophihabitans fulvus]
MIAVVVVALGVMLRWRPLEPHAMRGFDDLSQSASAFVGAGFCWWRARHVIGRLRLSWLLFGAAPAFWGAGEAVWSYYEISGRRELPFPSLADAGFLMFPLLALPALLLRASLPTAKRLRFVLDGVMVAASLVCLGWATNLGVTYHEGRGSAFTFTVSLAYPAFDILMLAVAVSVIVYARDRVVVPFVAGSLVAMSVADASFTYLTATGQYGTGTLTDLGWHAAFLGLAGAAWCESRAATRASHLEPERDAAVPSLFALLLPYAIVLSGTTATVVSYVDGTAAPATLAIQGVGLVALLLRQWLTVRDNRQLLLDVMAKQAELRFRAFHDGLTGLANRALFHDRLTHALALRERDQRGVTVVFCDLDDFKLVNDSLGHGAGDELLRVIGQRLRENTRESDTVARLGGDEFALLCEYDVDTPAMAARLLSVLREPVTIAGRTMRLTASIGTTQLRGDDPTPGNEVLLKRADRAMYAAKQLGKSAAVAFDPSADSASDESRGSEFDLRMALLDDIREGCIDVALQPIVRHDGSVIGFEALARWTYEGVPVPPDRFVPVADRAGALMDLDLLVAGRAFDLVAARGGDLTVAVNLGLSTLRQPGLVERVTDLVAESGLDVGRILVEVPETDQDPGGAVFETLERLRMLGLRIAIDDFGTGFSNLARVSRLVPDVIKLDKSLIAQLGDTAAPVRVEPATRIVASLIALAHELGATVVAEGVEEPAQHAMLTALGCDGMQGYLLGRPTVAERIVAVIPDAAPDSVTAGAAGRTPDLTAVA